MELGILRPVHPKRTWRHKTFLRLFICSVFGTGFVSQQDKIIAFQFILGRNRAATLKA